MIEEGFVRLYANDFASLAARAEAGVEVEALVQKRIGEARSHAALMDARKGDGHLPAVADRLIEESLRTSSRVVREMQDVEGAMTRRREFLERVADILRSPPVAAKATMAVRG